MRSSIVATVLLLAACSQSEPPTAATAAIPPTAEEIAAETARLNEWFEAKFEEQTMQSPLTMTFRGRKDRYAEVDDLSIDAADEQLERARQNIAELEAEFDYTKLTPEAQISYDIWKYQYEQAAAGVEFRRNNYVFDQMTSIHTLLVNFLINFHRVDELEDYEAYVARISGISRGLDQLLEQAKANAEVGVRPPRFAYEEVLKQSEALLTGAPFTEEGDAPLWSDAQRKLDALVAAEKIDDETKTRLLTETRNALADDFEPAYQRLIDFVAAELPKTAEIATGVGALPNGQAYYNYMLATSTTTAMTADEVHQLGLDEVARIRQEMVTLKEKVGFEGDLGDFFTFIREDEQ
ncbi:MAG: DUF885 domain-containing protein, partial [Pseudomonadota bacterium]